jgi:hypothetical protein
VVKGAFRYRWFRKVIPDKNLVTINGPGRGVAFNWHFSLQHCCICFLDINYRLGYILIALKAYCFYSKISISQFNEMPKLYFVGFGCVIRGSSQSIVRSRMVLVGIVSGMDALPLFRCHRCGICLAVLSGTVCGGVQFRRERGNYLRAVGRGSKTHLVSVWFGYQGSLSPPQHFTNPSLLYM